MRMLPPLSSENDAKFQDTVNKQPQRSSLSLFTLELWQKEKKDSRKTQTSQIATVRDVNTCPCNFFCSAVCVIVRIMYVGVRQNEQKLLVTSNH